MNSPVVAWVLTLEFQLFPSVSCWPVAFPVFAHLFCSRTSTLSSFFCCLCRTPLSKVSKETVQGAWSSWCPAIHLWTKISIPTRWSLQEGAHINTCASRCSASSLYLCEELNCLAQGCSCRKAVEASALPVWVGSCLGSGCLVRDPTTADCCLQSVQRRPLHPLWAGWWVTQYCFVYVDLLNRVQLDEQTVFGVCFLIADDLCQKTATCCRSSQSEILWLCMFNLYFIKPCKYMCKSRALSSKHGVLQGFSIFSVVVLGSCHGYHSYH